jgi:hypothetical protein
VCLPSNEDHGQRILTAGKPNRPSPHDSEITNMVLFESLGLVVTTDRDGKVVLWDAGADAGGESQDFGAVESWEPVQVETVSFIRTVYKHFYLLTFFHYFDKNNVFFQTDNLCVQNTQIGRHLGQGPRVYSSNFRTFWKERLLWQSFSNTVPITLL